jgi:GT2 family glycosyltransferase
MSRPDFSIILPSFNQARFIEGAICSALDQDASVEIIVVDGGSTDATLDILAACEDDISFWCTQWDSGPTEAINLGLARARGRYIGVLQADDLYQPDALASARRAFERGEVYADSNAPAFLTEEVQWVVGHAVQIDEFDEVLGAYTTPAADALVDLLRQVTPLHQLSATFFSRRLLQRYGGFDTTYRYDDGFDLACRLLDSGLRPTRTSQPTTAIRVHPESATATQTLNITRERLEIAACHAGRLPLPEQVMLRSELRSRRELLDLALMESCGNPGRAADWSTALRHPSWINDAGYRAALLAEHADVADQRRAA